MITIPPEDSEGELSQEEDPEIKELQAEISRLKKKQERDIARANLESGIAKSKADADLAAAKAQQDLEKHLTNKELDLLKSKIDAITKLIPESEEEGLSGEITPGDKFGYLSEQVAYASLDTISLAICERVKSGLRDDEARILITNDSNIARADLPYFEFISRCSFLKSISGDLLKRLENFISYGKEMAKKRAAAEENMKRMKTARFFPVGIPLILAGLSAAPNLAGTLSTLAGFFKTNYTIRGWEFTVSDNVIISSLAGALRSELGKEVYVLNMYPLDEDDLESDVMNKMFALLNDSYRLTQKNAVLSDLTTQEKQEITRITMDIDSLELKKSEIDPKNMEELSSIDSIISQKRAMIDAGQDWVQKAEEFIKEVELVNADVSTFIRDFTTVGAEQDFSKLVYAVIREKIKKRLDITHFLYVHVESRGGEAITMKKALGASGDTAYLGGIIVAFILMQKNGEIVVSGIKQSIHSFTYNLSGKGRNYIEPVNLLKKDSR